MQVVKQIDRRQSGKKHRNLTIHWQPFQPLPGTPMQWCGAGGGVQNHIRLLRDIERLPFVRVRQLNGRTDAMAKICTILFGAPTRGGPIFSRRWPMARWLPRRQRR